MVDRLRLLLSLPDSMFGRFETLKQVFSAASLPPYSDNRAQDGSLLFLVHGKRWNVEGCDPSSPQTGATGPIWSEKVSEATGGLHVDLHDRNATTNPTELPALSSDSIPVIYPHASSSNSTSRKKRSRKRIQEDLIAAIVKMTVRMNQAQTYIARACGN